MGCGAWRHVVFYLRNAMISHSNPAPAAGQTSAPRLEEKLERDPACRCHRPRISESEASGVGGRVCVCVCGKGVITRKIRGVCAGGGYGRRRDCVHPDSKSKLGLNVGKIYEEVSNKRDLSSALLIQHRLRFGSRVCFFFFSFFYCSPPCVYMVHAGLLHRETFFFFFFTSALL